MNTIQQVRELIEKKRDSLLFQGNSIGEIGANCNKMIVLQELLSELNSLPSDDDGLLFGGGDRKAPPLPLPPLP